jgi:tetratricopeptide (TPR) repeat protein
MKIILEFLTLFTDVEHIMADIKKNHIFISHATGDDEFVKKLRESLEKYKIPVWVDSRNLRGGNKLNPEIETAIENARHTIVVLSPNTVNSPWVRKEIKKSLEVEKIRTDDYRTIPVLLPGIEISALELWFDEEPVAIPINLDHNTLQNAMPKILSALGEQLPNDVETEKIDSKPIAELLLELEDPVIKTLEGETRAYANARISFNSQIIGVRRIESKRFKFRSPFGPIEFNKISWYLEEFYKWPLGVFKTRAKKTEKKLSQLGKALYEAILNHPEAREAVNAWKTCGKDYERHFSVMVDKELPDRTEDEECIEAEKAAALLLSIPWELLHDRNTYLIKGAKPVGIKRRLPNREKMEVVIAKLPVKILLVSARPEDEVAGYIDHRASAIPLISAVENLGSDLVSLNVCSPATFPEMMKEIKNAHESGNPYDVIHFDGHGVYNEKTGLGALCFEDPRDKDKLFNRRSVLVDAKTIGEELNQYRIPLMFLEACQTAKSVNTPTASVAATLLEKGISSVIAMTHSVLVETASKFVETFYKKIAYGARVGKAVLDAQHDLSTDTYRGKIPGAGDLHLQDWFVPVLYQDETDPRLFTKIPTKSGEQFIKKIKSYSFGKIAEEKKKMPHKFVGRSRELLALERIFVKKKYASIRGMGGAGKTAIALELAEWLVRAEKFEKAAFVCVENLSTVQYLLNEIAEQLLPDFTVEIQTDQKKALQSVKRELDDYATIIIIDNLESILPDPSQKKDDALIDDKLIKDLFKLCKTFLESENCRILFTSRERLPNPFKNNEIILGALTKTDAIDLVCDILKQNNHEPPKNDSGNTAEEIENLVNAVNCHARALVLITNEVATRGVLSATEDVNRIMADLHKRFPDNREKSLYASIELSLRRLPDEIRKKLKPLALFHGGVHLEVWAKLLNLKKVEEIGIIALQLINAGLAEPKAYGHLQLDPALPSYLLSQITESEKKEMQIKWAKEMTDFVSYLYREDFNDAKKSSHLTIFELPNLLALLEYIKDRYSPENVVNTASNIEPFISRFHKPKALKKVVHIREMANKNIKYWCKAAFKSEIMKIERFQSQGNLQEAFNTAQQLLKKSIEKGEEAYPGADYDIALVYYQNGKIHQDVSFSKKAIYFLNKALLCFGKIVDRGNKSAERMMLSSLTVKADCLTDLGELNEAENLYNQGLKISKKLDIPKSIATIKGSLGIVYICQKKHKKAIEEYREVLNIFQQLGEEKHVSVTYHQIGMIYEKTDNFKEAEKAYREALKIAVKIKDIDGEASTLAQLGILYDKNEHLEDAVTFHKRACKVYIIHGFQRKEGNVRNNLANLLLKLKRYDEARYEINRAIECNRHFGHTASPWFAFQILYNLEITTGNTEAAKKAWEKAFSAYLSYRKDGGYGISDSAQIVEIFKHKIKQGNTSELESMIEKYSNIKLPENMKLLFEKSDLILKGNREISLPKDFRLNPMDAVELHLLLEWLIANEL